VLGKGLIISAVFFGVAAQLSAQATRTWVSGVGDDANPCSRTAPCKTFAGAISKTAAGGEINVLDPGDFGSVIITKAITIDATGVEAGVFSNSTDGITVFAGATDKVTLRSLDIESSASGGAGIFFAQGLLTVENCRISGFEYGIDIQTETPNTKAFISNTLIEQSGGAGIFVEPFFTNYVVLDHVRAVNNSGAGLATTHPSFVYVSNSDFSHNGEVGVIAQGGAAISLESSSITFNGVGLILFQSSAARLSNVNVWGNTIGFDTAKGILNSFGNNHTTGNFDGVQPTINNHLNPL
jgi:hypothetical protein